MNTQSPTPTTLSEERLAELKRQYDAIEHKIVDPSRDFYVSGAESDKLIKFWTDLHNTFPTLLHAAEQMAIAHAALHKANEAMNTCKDHCYSDGSVHHQSYNSDKIGEAHIAVRQALPPAPEKGGQGA